MKRRSPILLLSLASGAMLLPGCDDAGGAGAPAAQAGTSGVGTSAGGLDCGHVTGIVLSCLGGNGSGGAGASSVVTGVVVAGAPGAGQEGGAAGE